MLFKKSTQKVLEKARKVLVKNPAATLQDIARSADIGRATLYRHFANREDLIEALALMTFEESDEAFEKIIGRSMTATQVLRETVSTYILMGDRYYFVGLSSSFMTSRKVRERYETQVQGLYQLIEMVKEEGGIRADMPTTWVASFIDALILSGIHNLSESDLEQSEVVALATETLFDGIG